MDDRRITQFSFNQQVPKDDSDHFLCNTCQVSITDEFYLRAGSRMYHESCLQCSVCHIILDEQSTCFLKDVHILCRQDYYKYFANKCAKCNRLLHPNDWIRRACEYVYHLTCFACYACERQLSTGEDYSLEQDHILCQMHIMDGNNDRNDHNKQTKTKRIRTAFNEEQLQVLQASFEIDQNPDGQELDQISQIIGLTKRVIQVWFQNTRARQKKQKASSQIRITSSNSNSSISDDSIDVLPKGTTHNSYQNNRTSMKRRTHITPINNLSFDDPQTNYNICRP